MEFLSKKEQDNVATKIYEKSMFEVFMSKKNQMTIAKDIYLMHKSNNGILDYLYFKGILPSKMLKWITYINIPTDTHTMDILLYLNKNFIKSHSNLYEYKSRDKIEVLVDTNVYRSDAIIGYCDDNDDVHIQQKKYKDLMPDDYGSIDVWKPQSTEIAPTSAATYGVKVPVWQRSMQVRNYDRSNEGYATTASRASINNFVSGYGDNMTLIQQKKDALYKKNNLS